MEPIEPPLPAGEPSPVAAEPPPPPPVAAEPPPPDPAFVAAVERDLVRGRRVAAITWLIALLHAALAFVALRQAAMLVDLDAMLTTTTDVERFGASVGVVRVSLVAVLAVEAVLVVRWLRSLLPTMMLLAQRGAVEPGSRGVGILFRPAGVSADQVSWQDVRVGSGRRLAWAAVFATALAAVLGLVAIVGLGSAIGVESAVAWRWLVGADGGLWVVSALLAGTVAADVSWRLAVAARAVGIFAPLSDSPGPFALRVIPAMLLFLGLVPIAATGPTSGAVDCISDTLECSTVIVPVDHRGGPIQDTISVLYGVHQATGPQHGTLVIAVGGPGASGIASADGIIDSLDSELVSRYDIVLWDQRGIGRSDGHNCPIAGGIYTGLETTETVARNFVDSCLKEANVGSRNLDRYATAQAAEDLEAIRARLGVDRFVLYGESYGTELAQVYAAAHPDRLSGLILDGAVDLTLSANDFWSAATRSFDNDLSATFEDCAVDQLCRDDVGDAGRAYDRLLARLGGDGLRVHYADNDGVSREHRIDRAAVESALDALMYEPSGRSLVQRAVAAAAHGDHVPIARLTDLFRGVASDVSMFAYHAIICADYRVSPTADGRDLAAVLASGRLSGALAARTDEIYYTQVPCLYWPVQPPTATRPPALTDLPAPIIVLGATLDPITPIEFGRSIASRAANGYLIETSGGPHVTFARGEPCVDRPVIRFLLEDRLPATRVLHCTGRVAEDYIPLTPIYADDYADALDAMASVEDELFADALYSFWGGGREFTIGCRYTGFVTISVEEDTDDYTFTDCEYAHGMALDGSGEYDYSSGDLRLDVTFSGGELHYRSAAERSVRGTFRGQSVNQHD